MAHTLPNEPLIRLGFFLGIFAAMSACECSRPNRERSVPRFKRWPHNLGVVALDTIVTRIVAPAGAAGFAMFAEAKHWGLFNQMPWPSWLEFVLSLVALDLAIYLQHRLFHHVP